MSIHYVKNYVLSYSISAMSVVPIGTTALLPKSVETLWSVMSQAHEAMTGVMTKRTIFIQVPLEVRVYRSHCG